MYLLPTSRLNAPHVCAHRPLGADLLIGVVLEETGAIDLELDAPVAKAFDTFVPMARARKNHAYLLSTSRGKRLLRQDMLKLFSRTTEKYLGKKIGIQILRVLKTTAHVKNIESSVQLQNEMGHGAAMQQQYISRKN